MFSKLCKKGKLFKYTHKNLQLKSCGKYDEVHL